MFGGMTLFDTSRMVELLLLLAEVLFVVAVFLDLTLVFELG